MAPVVSPAPARGPAGGPVASPRLAMVAGLAIGPWLLFALLMPASRLTWVGFGLDAAALVLLAVCRGRAIPLWRPGLVRAALGAVAASALLRFLVLPLWPSSEVHLEAVGPPAVEAFGASLDSTVQRLAGVTLLHLVAVGAFGLLLGIALLRRLRR